MEKFLKEAYGPEGRAVQVFLTVEEREEKSFAQCVGGGEWCQEGVAAASDLFRGGCLYQCELLVYFAEYSEVSCSRSQADMSCLLDSTVGPGTVLGH